MAGQAHETLPTPKIDGEIAKVLIVVAPYYREIANQLVAGAKAEIEAAGAEHEVIEVPGALEVPTAIRIAHNSGKYEGFVALGCVVRGETTHYETVCNDSSRAITLLGLQGACIGNGILTVENMPQAEARAEVAGQNKGGGAAAAALHLIALTRRFKDTSSPVGFRPAGLSLDSDPDDIEFT